MNNQDEQTGWGPAKVFDDDGHIVVRRCDHVAEVRFNRPDKLNAFLVSSYHGIKRAFEELAKDDDIRVIVLRGEGRSFSTGHDMNVIGYQLDNGSGKKPGQRHRVGYEEWIGTVVESILYSPKVVVAEARGHVLGIALDFYAAADITICSGDTVFGYPPSRMISATGVNAVYWMLRMGVALFSEITLLGKYFSATEAKEVGLVNRVTTVDELTDVTAAAVETVLAMPADGLYLAKFNKRQAYDLLGVRNNLLASAIGHAVQVQQRMEPEDWNLMTERIAGGARGAVQSRDERFREPLRRYDPTGVDL